MKNLLDRCEIPTWRASRLVLAAVSILAVAWVPPAAAQDGPGVRAGLGANPDQFYFGGHYVTRPIWDQMRFQPNVEAGFGDDMTLIAFNVEFAYWMKLNRDWSAYVGAGPALNLISSDHKDGTDVEPGLNVLAGFRYRSGLFFEMKIGAFDSPDFKLAVGYTFR
jgi:hypothetical protein